MFELLFTLYLLSGFIKGITHSYDLYFGIDITLITGVALTLYTGYIYFRDGMKIPPSTIIKRILPFGLFILWFAISLSYSPSEIVGPRKAFLLLTNIIAFVAPATISKFNVKRFVIHMLAVLFIIGLFSAVLYGCQANSVLHWLQLKDPDLPAKFYLSAGLCCAVAMLLALFLSEPWKQITLTVFFYLLVATAARGPLMLLVLTIIIAIIGIWLITHNRINISLGPKFRKRLAAFLLTHLVIITVISTSETIRPIFKRSVYRFSVLIPNTSAMDKLDGLQEEQLSGDLDDLQMMEFNESSSTVARLIHLRYCFSMVSKSFERAVFGYGIGSYGLLKNGVDEKEYPHNIFLETWFETGLIGLILLCSLLIISLLRMIKLNNWIFGIITLFILLNAMKSYSIIDLRLLFGFMGLACFVNMDQPILWVSIELKESWKRFLSKGIVSRLLQ